MQISPIIIQDDKLLQFIDSGQGFSFALFRTKESKHNSFSNLDLFQTKIHSLNELSQFKTYFDTLQQLKMYIQQPSYLKASKDGNVQVYATHPIKKNQNLKIGEIKLRERTQNNEQDFSLINRLCMSERDLQNHEIKSILLRLSRQLEKVSEKCQNEKQNCQSIQQIQTCHQIVEKAEQQQIISSQDNKSFAKTIEENMQKEMGIFRDVIAKKIELMSNQIEINKQFVLDQICQIKQQLSATQKQRRKMDVESERKLVYDNCSQKLNQFIQPCKQQSQSKQQNKSQKEEQQQVQEEGEEEKKEAGRKEENEEKKEENEEKEEEKLEEGQEKKEIREEQEEEQEKNNAQQQDQALVLTKIKDILPRSQSRINIIAKVLSVQRIGRMAKVMLGDQTGVVEAFLLRCSLIKVGKTILLQDCIGKLRNKHIQIVMHRELGYIYETNEEINEVNMHNYSLFEHEEISE